MWRQPPPLPLCSLSLLFSIPKIVVFFRNKIVWRAELHDAFHFAISMVKFRDTRTCERPASVFWGDIYCLLRSKAVKKSKVVDKNPRLWNCTFQKVQSWICTSSCGIKVFLGSLYSLVVCANWEFAFAFKCFIEWLFSGAILATCKIFNFDKWNSILPKCFLSH